MHGIRKFWYKTTVYNGAATFEFTLRNDSRIVGR